MRVILLKDVRGVGQKFEEKNVADGYALNFLIPGKLALVANTASMAKIKQLKEQSEAKRINEEERLKEKELKRTEKHLELEKFRNEQKGPLD